MFKNYLLIIFCLTIGFAVNAQEKPALVNENPYADLDYIPGKLLVKLKPEYRDILKVPTKRSSKTSRAFKKLKLKTEQLYHNHFIRRHSRRANNPSGVDISLFYSMNYDASTTSLEDVIREMKSLGVFEYVEPDVIYKLAYDPSDTQISEQYYLETIKAYEAWDITKGSEDIVIGVADAGSDFNHPDLQNQFYTNPNEVPDNNIDDDENGYIDDVRGWDFAGIDTLSVRQDNDAQIFVGGTNSHGTWVAGAAAAETDNGIGIAGVGFNSKLLTTKHTFDNQREDDPSVFNPYAGVIFLTESKVDVMNLSWGGPFRSDIAEEIINVAALDEDIVIVAAAGNDGNFQSQYPSSYENVISVAALDREDQRADFTNKGADVDISAPGVAILTTNFEGDYQSVQGTSFSSPIVAGAAALLRAHFPDFTAKQITRQLVVNANPSIYTVSVNAARSLGSGKLDVFSALTGTKPGVLFENISIVNSSGNTNIQAGDTAFIVGDFTNYLFDATSELKATMEISSPWVSVLNNSISLGAMETGQTVNNLGQPFSLVISDFAISDLSLNIRIDFTDQDYTDYRFVEILINPSIVDIERNLVSTSLPNNGKFGFRDFDGNRGIGFVFQEIPLLFEMGLIMGTSENDISSTVRGEKPQGSEQITVDDDFVSRSPLLSQSPGERSVFEVFGSFDNDRANNSTKVNVDFRSLVFAEDPNDQYVIMEYDIQNIDTTDINNYYIGLFADWDIGSRDSSDWNSDYRLGYIFNTNFTDTLFAGIQALTGEPNYFPINNNPDIAGTPFGIYDGFSNTEKFKCLSSGESVLTHSNTPKEEGNDMSHTVGSGPYNIPVGGSIKVAFAIHAGENLEDILRSAEAADKMYNQAFNLTKPTLSFTPACIGEAVEISAAGGSSFKWYSEQFGGDAFFEGNVYNTTPLADDTVIYVSQVENGIESLRQAVTVETKANPAITVGGRTQICFGDTTRLIARLADSYLWSNGATTRSIAVTESGNYSVTVADNTLGCSNTSDPINILVDALPVADFDLSLNEIDIRNNAPIQFTDQSSNAVAWDWNFGNGRTSQEQNPSIEFTSVGDFTVELTVTSGGGCSSFTTKTISVTAIDDDKLLPGVSVFPNPNTGMFEFELENDKVGPVELQLSTVNGKIVRSETLIKSGNKLSYGINISDLPAGLYLLKAIQDDKFSVKRVLKEE